MAPTTTTHRKAVIGSPSSHSFWLYDSTTGFDLTHPPSPTTNPITPRLTLQTTTAPITIAPAKSALVIIDMQNFFLSPCLGRPETSNGLRAQAQLLQHAIPAARAAGIRIVWLNWGLTQHDLDTMPPATLRAFGFETVDGDAALDEHGVNQAAAEELAHTQQQEEQKGAGGPVETTTKTTTTTTAGKDTRIYKGLGSDVGPVTLANGQVVPGGGLLMRDTWNADLTPPLRAQYDSHSSTSSTSSSTTNLTTTNGPPAPADVWIHKNRMSGLWGSETPCTSFLEHAGITTLLFAGVNTDQCVGGSLQDAFTKGWDCILLSDGAGTTSPAHSQLSIEFNCARTWGFVLSCEDFAKGVREGGLVT